MKIKDFGYSAVQIEVTNKCNMKCTFCALPERDLPLRDMELQNVFKILDYIAKDGSVDFVAFHHFNEPLLYKGIWEAISYAKKVGVKTQLISNGLLLTKENVDKIIQNAPDKLVLSLQILDPELHNKARGIGGTFDMYFERIAEAAAALFDNKEKFKDIRIDVATNEDAYSFFSKIKMGIKVALGMDTWGDPTIGHPTPKTLFPHIEKFLQAIESKSKTFKYDRSILEAGIKRYYSGESKNVDGNENHFHRVTYEFGSRMVFQFKTFVDGRKINHNFPIEKATCGTQLLGLMVDGSVVPCCMDTNGDAKLGNFLQEDLIQILQKNKKILDDLRNTGDLHFDACKRCLGAPTRFGAFLKSKQLNWQLSKLKNKN